MITYYKNLIQAYLDLVQKQQKEIEELLSIMNAILKHDHDLPQELNDIIITYYKKKDNDNK
jgi:hypothetical protein